MLTADPKLAAEVRSIAFPVSQRIIKKLEHRIARWHDELITLACKTDLELCSLPPSSNPFHRGVFVDSSAPKKEIMELSAQYNVAITKAQLELSRVHSEAVLTRLKSASAELQALREFLASTIQGKLNVSQRVTDEPIELIQSM